MEGDRPAWGQKSWFSITAAKGRKSKRSVKTCHTLALPYLQATRNVQRQLQDAALILASIHHSESLRPRYKTKCISLNAAMQQMQQQEEAIQNRAWHVQDCLPWGSASKATLRQGWMRRQTASTETDGSWQFRCLLLALLQQQQQQGHRGSLLHQ